MIADPRDLHTGATADGAGDDMLSSAVANRDDVVPPTVTYQAGIGGGGGN